MTAIPQAALNTDREIWRERPNDYYAPSIFVTNGPGGEAGIGMDVGGHVIVMPIRKWHALASFHVTSEIPPGGK